MAIGTLKAEAILDHPKHIYRGSEEPVTGYVALRWTPKHRNDTTAHELLGAINVKVSITCYVRTKINDSLQALSVQRDIVWSKTLRLPINSVRIRYGAVEHLPFTLCFPTDGVTWSALQRSDGAGFRIPPTTDKITSHSKVTIFYALGVDVTLPGLRVSVYTPPIDQQAQVIYEQPSPRSASLPRQFVPSSQHISIRNKSLQPANQQPSGIRQHLRAAWRSTLCREDYPEYHCAAELHAPKVIRMGKPIELQLLLKNDKGTWLPPVEPQIRLKDVSVTLESTLKVRALGNCAISKAFWAQHISYKSQLMAVGKHQSLATRSIEGALPSFAATNVSRKYMLKVTVRLCVANKNIKMYKEFPVEVY